MRDKNLKNKMLIIIFSLLALLITPSSFALDEENTDSIIVQSIKTGLIDAEQMLVLFDQNNIPRARYSNLLNSTKRLFAAQEALNREGGESDYESVTNQLSELNKLSNLAFNAHDELNALKLALNTTDELLNDEVLKDLLLVAINEYETERFELSIEAIDKAYSRLSELEATETKLRAAYTAASRNIRGFLYSARFYFLGIFIILTLTILIGRKRYLIYKAKEQINNLVFKKKVIEELIEKTQRAYFEEGKLSESTYHIRTTKYSEIIRDINRELPLLREKIELLSNNNFEKQIKKAKKAKQGE